MLLDEDCQDEICLRSINQKLQMKYKGLKISDEAIRIAIKKDLKYTYKKVYFRSYSKDDQKIKETRFWLTFAMF